jgi:hypothetical protein
MRTLWLLLETITLDPFPHAVFTSHEKLEAYVKAKGGSMDGGRWDFEEIDLDPEAEQ